MKRLMICMLWIFFMTNISAQQTIIAHRGASGYLPEHTLASKVLAFQQGATYLEQDVIMTKDDVLIVFHDLYLERVTNVKEIFDASRARADHHYYVLDFTFEELQKLTLHEGSYPNRFQGTLPSFKIPSFEEEIDLLLGLNKVFHKSVGLYVEIKNPYWHEKQGKNLVKAILDLLRKKGYDQKGKENPSPIVVEAFDHEALRYLRHDLKCDLPLSQLLGENSWNEDERTDYDFLKSREGLAELKKLVQGVGPWVEQIITDKKEITSLVEDAHREGLFVHPYTLRQDDLPRGFSDFNELLELLFHKAHVDGAFTDFPDQLHHFLGPKN